MKLEIINERKKKSKNKDEGENRGKKIYTANLLKNVENTYNSLMIEMENVAERELKKYPLSKKDNQEKVNRILLKLKKKHKAISNWYNLEEALRIIEYDLKRPEHFEPRNGEIIKDLNFKIEGKDVDVHHGHLMEDGKLHTIYWGQSPVDSSVMVILLLEEHPKNNRGYSPKELIKRLPKVIPANLLRKQEDKEVRLQDKYDSIIKSVELGDLVRVSVNENKIGAIYRFKYGEQYYLFIALQSVIRKNSYLYVKLAGADLKKLFKYKYTGDEDSLSHLEPILKNHANEIGVVIFEGNEEKHEDIKYSDEIITKLRQRDLLNIKYKSVNERLEFILEVFGMIEENLSEEYRRGYLAGYNSVKFN